MNKIFLFLTSFLMVNNVFGEKLIITVDKAVEMALANNLELKQSRISLQSKKTSLDASFNFVIPSIAVSAGFSGAEQLFTDAKSSVQAKLSDPGALSFNAGVSAKIPFNIASINAIEILREDYKAGLINLEQVQKKLKRDVQKQFYLILGNNKNIDIQESNIDLAEKRLERAKKNFSLGLSSELDVLSAEVSLARLLPKYNSVLANQENQLSFFKFLIGINQEDELILDGELVADFYELDSSQLISRHLSKRMDIMEITHKILNLKKQRISVLLRDRTPTLEISYSYQYGMNNSETSPSRDKTIEPWTNGSDSGTLKIALSWKLDGFIPYSKTDINARKLKNSINSTILTRDIAKEKAIIEITNLVNKLNTSQKNIEANERIVTQAKRNYELTDQAYKVGSRDFLDVETAQNNLLSSNQQLVLARYEYIAGLLDLEFALNTSREDFAKDETFVK